jgi:hypothetical protein
VLFGDALEVDIPSELETLWQVTSELRLYEDMTYGQWGVVIWGPDTAIGKQAIMADRRSDFQRGDLIIGEFLGDWELLMLRCDKSAPDFGNAVIVLPMDARPLWPTIGGSLEEFLLRRVQENGRKFWFS